MGPELIGRAARRVLEHSPAPALSSDLAFAALGWAAVAPERGLAALEQALSGEWADGRVPRQAGGDPSGGRALATPPWWALVAARLYKHGADPDRLRALLPRIDAAHRFFAERRDPEGWRCVAVAHPWESPLPESPGFDSALAHVRGRDPAARRHTLALAAEADAFGMAPFSVYDPLATTLLARAEDTLATLCAALGQVNPAAGARAAALGRGLRHRLYDVVHARYRFYDVRHRTAAVPDALSTYGPAMLADAPGRDAMRSGLRTRLWSTWPLATVAATDGAFSPREAGRGAIQMELSWLFSDVLGADLIERSLALMGREGFRPAYDGRSGEGQGDEGWLPAAAVALDWLSAAGIAC